MPRPGVLSWVTWGSCPRWGTRTPASLCCTTSVCYWCSSTRSRLTSTLTSLLLLKLARCVAPTVCVCVFISQGCLLHCIWVWGRIIWIYLLLFFRHKGRQKQVKTSLSLSPFQCDYSLVQSNFSQLEAQCKASWEQLKILDKAEDKRKGGKAQKRRGGGEDEASTPEGSLRRRLPKILKEYEERLKVLRAVHRRVINRCAASAWFISFCWFKLTSASRFNTNLSHTSCRPFLLNVFCLLSQ